MTQAPTVPPPRYVETREFPCGCVCSFHEYALELHPRPFRIRRHQRYKERCDDHAETPALIEFLDGRLMGWQYEYGGQEERVEDNLDVILFPVPGITYPVQLAMGGT